MTDMIVTPQDATPQGEGKTVLAILKKDDQDLMALLRAGLEPEGYTLNFEHNQLFAAQCVRDGFADFLILDMALLGQRTAELVRLMRHHGSRLPVLVLAGDPATDDVFHVLKAGADDFVQKPIQGPDHIALAMRRLHLHSTCVQTNLRLQLKQERARKREQLNLDRVKFFRFASHELKSPLVSIQSSLMTLEALAKDRLDPAMTELISRSNARSDQMISMINDLLALSIERSDIRDIYQELDLAEMTREAVTDHISEIRAKNIDLRSKGCSVRVILMGNRFGLEKAITNLIGNAVRYTPARGSIQVTLQTKSGFAVLQVSDTGIGIPTEDQERVFEEFYRARNARKTVSIGSGLGLSLVKKIIEDHGGWVILSSAAGEGTTFRVWLPLRRR